MKSGNEVRRKRRLIKRQKQRNETQKKQQIENRRRRRGFPAAKRRRGGEAARRKESSVRWPDEGDEEKAGAAKVRNPQQFQLPGENGKGAQKFERVSIAHQATNPTHLIRRRGDAHDARI